MEIINAPVQRARALIDEHGHLSVGDQGQPRPHPAVRIEQEAMRDYLRFAEEFGLTPVARTRLGLAELRRRSMDEELRDTLGSVDLKPVD